MFRIIAARALILCLFNFFITASPIESSEIDAEIIDELSLSDLLDMKISTGSFLELDIQRSPLSMTIISSDMIRTSGARHMSELLDIYVPGFIYNYNKWAGTIWALRGVATDRNTKIIYLVNGHKMNTQTRDGFQSETVLGLLGDIERVEVLRGPAGLVYGTGAIAGIINVVTKKAEDNNSSFSLNGSNSGSKSVEGNFYAIPAENHQLSVSFGFLKSEGLPYFSTRIYGLSDYPITPGFPQGVPSDGRFGVTDGNWKIAGDWTFGDFNLYFRATRQRENAGAFMVLDPWPEIKGYPFGGKNTVIDGNPIAKDDRYWTRTDNNRTSTREYLSDNFMFEMKYDLTLAENILKLKTGIDKSTTRITRKNVSSYPPEYVYRNGFVEETFGDSRYLINSTYLLKSIPRLQAAIGMELRADVFGDDMNGDNEIKEKDKHFAIYETIYYNYSLFGEGFYDITDHIGGHAGVRLDLHSRAVMFNPKLAVIFSPAEEHSLKFIYQSASNNGTVDNYEYNRNNVDDSGKIVTVPRIEGVRINPDVSYESINIMQPSPSREDLHKLKPEKVHSIEIAYVGHLFNSVSIEPSVSWSKIMDLFGWSQDLKRVVNVGQYEYINADLDMKYSIDKFMVGAVHTFQRPVRTNPDKQEKTYSIYALDSTGHDGHFGFGSGVDDNGDSTYTGYYSLSDSTKINVVKSSVTYDGEHFMSIPDHMTKLYMIYSPFDWLSLGTNLRLIWGLPGMKSVIQSKDTLVNATPDSAHYFGYYHEKENQSIKDFFMESVSKKWNFSVNIHLPHQFDANFYVYNILGSDKHSSDATDLDRNTVNTFRKAQVYDLEHRDLYSTDQRTLGVTITKRF